MAKESGMKRKGKPTEFKGEVPLTSKIKERVKEAKVALSIIMTDRGLYLNAKKRLREIYTGTISKIRSLFKRE